jgi:hypothetical protein
MQPTKGHAHGQRGATQVGVISPQKSGSRNIPHKDKMVSLIESMYCLVPPYAWIANTSNK